MDNPQGTLNVTEVELGWLAGMIDGEGAVSFSVYFRTEGMNTIRVKPQVIISGTEKVMIEKAADIISRLGVGVHFQTREQLIAYKSSLASGASKYRPLHVVTVAGFKRAAALLSIISEHLVSTKREKSEMMLQYMSQRLQKTADHGRWATHDADDLRLMMKIMEHARDFGAKGTGPRYLNEIKGLLRDLEQNERHTQKPLDDIVRPAGESCGEPTREGSAPLKTRVFGGVSKLMAS